MEKRQTEKLLNITEKARELGVTCETLRVWRKEGKGPAYVRYSEKMIRYWPERPPEQRQAG